jgi:pimeloyl-ACP methyl ester carboxylesterase
MTGYDKRTLASDVYQLVKTLGYDKIGLTGYDWGGAVAFYFAYDHPVSANVEAYLSYFYTSTTYNCSPTVLNKEDIAEYVRVYSLPGALRAGFQYYRAGMQEDLDNLSSCTQKLTMPVLAWGGDVFLGNIVPMWQTVAENVQGGEVKQCGHFMAEEKPEFVMQQALEFFNPLRA